MAQGDGSAGDLVIAADFGTSGVKIGIVDRDFRILARTAVPYPLSLPGPSRAEQNPLDWWAALGVGLRTLADEVPHLSQRAAAISICAQMCGVVLVDEAGEPLRPCLIWLDKRAAETTRRLVGGFPSVEGYRLDKALKWVRLANGAPSRNGMDPPGKMLWLAQSEPDVFARTYRLLDVKDWLIHRATGRFTTTADCANLTWLMDTRPGREGWSPALSRMTGIGLERLPDIVDGTAIVAGLTPVAAADLGLRIGTPVIGGAGDVTASAIGSGAVEDGQLHLCLGTSSWVSGFFPRRVLAPFHSYATIASSVAYRPLLIATQENAGSAYAWAVRLMQLSPDGNLTVEPGEAHRDDPFFLPWLAGERVPVDEERLRGAFHGLSLRHDRQAVLRGVIEGIALNTRWAYEKVSARKGVRQDGRLPLIGAAALNPHLVQAMADALDRRLIVGEAQYAGVLGAAALAAPAAGWTATVWDAARTIAMRPAIGYEPRPDRVAGLADRRKRLERIRPALIKLYRSEQEH